LVQEKLLPHAEVAKHLEWDDEKQRFWVTETKEWQGLSVGGEHRRPAAAAEIEGQLAEVLLARWDRLLAGNEALSRWFERLRHLGKMNSKWALPTEEQIREALQQASYGENSLAGVSGKDLVPFFEQLLPAEQRDALLRECPAFLTVPTGNRLPIKYSEEQGPQLEVRLQELFGLRAAPLVGGQPLTLVLLAPNYRPVQVTRDLASFWQNGYPEVRKEMRARYPKHSWPDDPLTAAPQSKGRPRTS
jgi:ATP-dependent helicase HrpB